MKKDHEIAKEICKKMLSVYKQEMKNVSNDATNLSSITGWIGSAIILNFARFLKTCGYELFSEEELIQMLVDGALESLSSWREFYALQNN